MIIDYILRIYKGLKKIEKNKRKIPLFK